MSPHDESPAANRPQFHIRHLLIAMALAAVACAMIAPTLRNLDYNRCLLLATALSGIGIGLFLLGAVIFLPRYLARKRAGALLLNLSQSVAGKENFLFRGGFYVFAFLFILTFWSMWLSNRPYVDGPWTLDELYKLGLLAVAATFAFPYVVAPISDPQLCENGLLWGTLFVPWQNLTDVRWSPHNRYALHVDLYYLGELSIRADQRDQVEAILCERCPSYRQANKTNPEE